MMPRGMGGSLTRWDPWAGLKVRSPRRIPSGRPLDWRDVIYRDSPDVADLIDRRT